MRFGPTPLEAATGAILAHSVAVGGLRLKKGRVLRAEDIAALRSAGLSEVIAARLDADDVHEDAAAAALAQAIAGPGVTIGAAFTGRVNLFAPADGLCSVDAAALDRINALDESLTAASLAPLTPVTRGQTLATIKMIPFAVPRGALEDAIAIARAADTPVIGHAAYRPLRVRLLQTTLPGIKTSVLDKTTAITRARIEALGGRLAGETRCAHDTTALSAALRDVPDDVDLLLIAGASAITDRRDVLPAALEWAGGAVEHFGMPVDPGNLLLLARYRGKPALGLPGCARSPKLNGFDWVLQRLACDLPVTRAEIVRMGAGGLLAEIDTRPQPRAGTTPARKGPKTAALILAAGQSRRMGGRNKLLLPVAGRPMLRHVAEAIAALPVAPILAVTGHEADAVEAALKGLPVRPVANPDYAQGLSTSLKAGIAALPEDVDAVLVCLGDMPRLTPDALKRLLAAFNPVEGRAIVVPTVDGKRGNPVLWARQFFAEMQRLHGDVGAKHLIGANEEWVVEVAMDDSAALDDIDTPERYAELVNP